MASHEERSAAFELAVKTFRSDGNFVTTASVGVGAQISIDDENQKGLAVVVRVVELDDEKHKVYFRWLELNKKTG